MDSDNNQASPGLSVEQGASAIANLFSDDGQKKKPEEQAPDSPAAEPTGEAETAETQGDTEAEEQTEQSEDSDTEQTVEPTRYRVKVDGQEFEVTLDEALQGYQRQQVFTKKTQEYADLRKQTEALRAETEQIRAQYLQGLQYIHAQAQPAEQEPDWQRLAEEDPVGYVQQQALWMERQRKAQLTAAEHRRVMEHQMREAKAQQEQRLQSEYEQLIHKIPDYRDDAKRAALQKELRSYAPSLGFSQEELDGSTDHRAVLALWKAMQYDKMMASRQKVAPQVERVVSPGQNVKQANPTSKLREQAKRTGSVEDAAKALKAMGLLSR